MPLPTALVRIASFGFTSGCVATLLVTTLPGQTRTHHVSGALDAASAPSAGPLPGLRHGFRQQIHVGAQRLQALVGKELLGIRFRRDLSNQEALVGGDVELTMRLSTRTKSPDQAVGTFAVNAPPTTQTLVFQGTVRVPNSPTVQTSSDPWASDNAFTVPFQTPLRYTGGTLCIDMTGQPKVPGQPHFWFVDHEYAPSGGRTRTFGTSCSNHRTTSGTTIEASKNGLVLGGTIHTTLFGAPGAQPLLLFGAQEIPGGIDLSLTGAQGCRQHIGFLLIAGLRYHPLMQDSDVAFVDFIAQVPFDRSLLGARLYLQGAESQLALPPAQRTNAAGLTTTSGLEIQIAATQASLGMATVRSEIAGAGTPIPAVGTVDVERAPVMRILYRD